MFALEVMHEWHICMMCIAYNSLELYCQKNIVLVVSLKNATICFNDF